MRKIVLRGTLYRQGLYKLTLPIYQHRDYRTCMRCHSIQEWQASLMASNDPRSKGLHGSVRAESVNTHRFSGPCFTSVFQ